MDSKILNRFWSKVNKVAPNGCWEWTAHTNEHGYGRIKIDGKHQLAHRFSWMICNGEIPEMAGSDYRGTCVLHKCDNRKCVNPKHLFLGTHKDNINDRDNKNRAASAVGESNGCSKLTARKVNEIRYKQQFYTQRVLAAEYGVSQSVIHNVITGKSWKHIDYPPTGDE